MEHERRKEQQTRRYFSDTLRGVQSRFVGRYDHEGCVARQNLHNSCARFACKEDCPEIRRLLQEVLYEACGSQSADATHTERCGKELLEFFGNDTISSPDSLEFLEDLIDESYQCIVVEDTNGGIVGFAAFNHSPRLLTSEIQNEATHSSVLHSWPEWLQATYYDNRRSRLQSDTSIQNKVAAHGRRRSPYGSEDSSVILPSEVPDITPSNTLWINFLTYKSTTASAVLATLAEAMFASAFDLQNLLIFNRPRVRKPLPNLFDIFPAVVYAGVTEHKDSPRVHACTRSHFIRPLKIRKAKVEDYDDLVKVFDSATELRSGHYGEFFLAELIGGQDDRNTCLAAEAEGLAVGMAAFTTEVDINLLNNCFELENYDFLVDREYMNKIRTTRHVPYFHELNQVLDTKEAVMLILWQAHFTDSALRSASAITPGQALSAFSLFMKVDCLERQRVSTFLLEKWKALAASFAKADSIPGAGGGYGDIPAHRVGESVTGDTERDAYDSTIKVHQFCELLLTHPDIKMPPDDVSELLMALHWWADVPIYHPASDIARERLKSALQRLSRAALEHLSMTYGTSGWLQKLPIEHKNAFAINIFGLDKQWHSQALELILPAFSVFKDKDYCVVLQPSSAPVLPFMRYFSPEKKKLTSSFNQLLFLLHRQTLLTTPLFRQMRNSDVGAVLEKTASVGLRLSQEALMSAVDDPNGNGSDGAASNCDDAVGDDSSSSQMDDAEGSEDDNDSGPNSATPTLSRKNSENGDQPADSFVVVGTACGEVIAIAEIRSVRAPELQDMMLKYDIEPYLLHHQKQKIQEVRELLDDRRAKREARCKLRRLVEASIEEIERDEQIDDKLSYDAFGGHVVIKICLLDSAFQYYESLFLREIMRLARAKLLHMVVEPNDYVSPAFYQFFPVKPKAISAVKYLDTIAANHGYFACPTKAAGRPGQDATPERIKASVLGRRSTVHQALQFFKKHEASAPDSPIITRAHRPSLEPEMPAVYPSSSLSAVSHLVCRPSFLSSYPFTFFARIIVVGFSATAYSFLKNLLFANRTFHFKDITLLAPGGLPLLNRVTKPLLSQSTTDYDEASEIRRLLLDLRVRIVNRRIHRIDRRNKLIHLGAAGSLYSGPGSPSSSVGVCEDGSVQTAPPPETSGRQPLSEEGGLNSIVLPYDFLILTTGMQDAALQSIGVRSWGLPETPPAGTDAAAAAPREELTLDGNRGIADSGYPRQRRVNGCISSADPRLYHLLDEDGPYLVPLRWNPLTSVVVYGRSLDAYCLVHGLLSRDVPAQKITIILPPRSSTTASSTQLSTDKQSHGGDPEKHLVARSEFSVSQLELSELVWCSGREDPDDEMLPVSEFAEGEPMEVKCHDLLANLGVTLLEGYTLRGVVPDSRGRLKSILLEHPAAEGSERSGSEFASSAVSPHAVVAFKEEDEAFHSRRSFMEELADDWQSGGFLITADKRNVDGDVFEAVHESGLVYDGRLIVNRRFQIGFYLAASLIRRLNPLFLCTSHPAASSPFFGERLLDRRILRPPKELLVPFASVRGLFATPAVGELQAYLNYDPASSRESDGRNRLACLPRFSFPLCVQGVLPGALNFYRLSLCSRSSLGRPPSDSFSRARPSAPASASALPIQQPREGASTQAPQTFRDDGLREEGGRDVVEAATCVATDTLAHSWGDWIDSNAGDAQRWRHLLSIDGQVTQIELDELQRVRQFKYLGPTRLRLDTFFFLMGLPISFFNRVQEKRKAGDSEDLMAFFSEEERWFEALLHSRMAAFLRRQKSRLAQDERIKKYVHATIESLREKREAVCDSPSALQQHGAGDLSQREGDNSFSVLESVDSFPSITLATQPANTEKQESIGSHQGPESSPPISSSGFFPTGESLSKQRQFEQVHLAAGRLDDFHRCVDKDLKRSIQAELIDFLREHREELDAFYIPPKATYT
ncbi:hypothetical protein BESB_073570 [Besnoitia besnoiti]|uniref:Cilia- and flagella-associated protein 61 N-terminal domain-containing protein n=1 Tax=Besnoitia besnoiti TaxID=94643 RepID=A0A2A9M887_BESBE|nr:uncharacterized protein BESB_073570 [Besnoitia besnoiti]PFH34205.1 hypothetical protein BESB_073570 [Besnoitia besnoiti]